MDNSNLDKRCWTVLGGWGVKPTLMKPVFGEQSTFIDINPLMPSLIDNGVLSADWKDRLYKKIVPFTNSPHYLAGWSTGAIAALALAPILKPSALVLFSATLSFCKRENFSFGARKPVLRSMIQSLGNDSSIVLKEFYERCGLSSEKIDSQYTEQELVAGLNFLESVSIDEPEIPAGCKTLLFGGKQDKIIVPEAGRATGKSLGCLHIEYDGQHAFFINNEKNIRIIINKLIGGDN